MSRKTAGVDTTRFNAMIRALGGAIGVPADQALAGEVIAILEKAVRATRAAKTMGQLQEEMRQDKRKWRTYRGKKYAVKPVTLNTRSGKPRKRPGSGMRYPNFLWAQIVGLINESNIRKLEYVRFARGLGKRHWVDIGKSLGLPIKAPGYVQSAKPMPSGTTFAVKKKSRLNTTYTIGNSYRKNPYVNARKALQRAINGRVGYFKKNLRTGVFRAASSIARKYGATVSR